MLSLRKLLEGSVSVADCKITIEHIDLTNIELENGGSLNKLDKSEVLSGLSRKAFKANALKLGYIFNSELNRFITNGVIDNTVVTPRNNNSIIIKKDVKKKVDKMSDFEDRLKALEDIVLLSNTNITPSNFQLDSRALNNDIMTRSIKVSKNAMDVFTDVAEGKLSMYSKQDLLSQALLEFADKYK